MRTCFSIIIVTLQMYKVVSSQHNMTQVSHMTVSQVLHHCITRENVSCACVIIITPSALELNYEHQSRVQYSAESAAAAQVYSFRCRECSSHKLDRYSCYTTHRACAEFTNEKLKEAVILHPKLHLRLQCWCRCKFSSLPVRCSSTWAKQPFCKQHDPAVYLWPQDQLRLLCFFIVCCLMSLLLLHLLAAKETDRRQRRHNLRRLMTQLHGYISSGLSMRHRHHRGDRSEEIGVTIPLTMPVLPPSYDEQIVSGCLPPSYVESVTIHDATVVSYSTSPPPSYTESENMYRRD